MRYFYFDTETTDYSTDAQPALPVEVALLVADEERVYTVLSSIIDQRSWTDIRRNSITERVVRIHGIDDHVADTFGEPAEIILQQFRRILSTADYMVGHNIEFDLTVMTHAFKTQRLPVPHFPPAICTMRESAPIIKMPATGRYSINGYKAPKLSEAYRWFSGKELQGAHGALNDTYGSRLVHRGIMRYANGKPVGPDSRAAPTIIPAAIGASAAGTGGS